MTSRKICIGPWGCVAAKDKDDTHKPMRRVSSATPRSARIAANGFGIKFVGWG